MTLSNKKSRPVSIDGASYRYQISTTKISDNLDFSINLTVQNAEFNGSVLQVSGLITRDVWLDFSDGKKWNKNDYPIITPKHVAVIVRRAHLAGWEPSKPGTAFRLDTSNGEVFNFRQHP